jgi:hypothetical protein
MSSQDAGHGVAMVMEFRTGRDLDMAMDPGGWTATRTTVDGPIH